MGIQTRTNKRAKHKPRLICTKKHTRPKRAVWTGPGSCAHGKLPMYSVNARDYFNSYCSLLQHHKTDAAERKGDFRARCAAETAADYNQWRIQKGMSMNRDPPPGRLNFHNIILVHVCYIFYQYQSFDYFGLHTKFHWNRMIPGWVIAIKRFSKWRGCPSCAIAQPVIIYRGAVSAGI